MNPFELLQLPLSAYTPGQGDQSMEGGFETASGAPVYTYEMYLQGQAPYVTGATNMKKPSGTLVYRTIGNQQVPVRITDYGPGVKGIDIATQNKAWAKNFPYQGATDRFMLADDRKDLLNEIDNSIYGGGQAPPMPTPTPSPTPQRVAANGPDGMGFGNFAGQGIAQSGMTPASWGAYANALTQPGATNQAASVIGMAFNKAGQGMEQQSQQGMQQALAMLHSDPRAQQLLAQYANNPMMYLAPLSL